MTHETPANPLPVERLKQFQLLRLIGRGQSSAVYEVHDQELDRKVAIKLLNAELAGDSSRARHFFSQAAAAAKILHPNIARIYYVGQEGPHCFCAREFIDGISLEERLIHGERFSEAAALNIADQILQGLAATESLGMRHGNLHARNVLFDRTGSRIVLSDLQAAVQLGADTNPTESASPELPQINADLLSAGLLLRRLPLLSAPEESPEATATRTAACNEIMERLEGSGQLPPFRSAAEALAAIQSLVASQVTVENRGVSVSGNPSVFAPGQLAGSAAPFEFQELEADPQLPDGLFEAAQSRYWYSVYKGVLRRLGLAAPENPQRLKDTQAAVDGVLVEMQRRLRDLNRVAKEGEEILRDLQLQADRPATSDGVQRDSATLAASIANQQRQLDQIKARQSDLDRKVQGLTQQRDALHARLIAAESRGANVSQPQPASRTRSALRQVARIGLVLGLFTYAGYLIIQLDEVQPLLNWLKPKKFGAPMRTKGYNPHFEPIFSWIPAEMTAVPINWLRNYKDDPPNSISFCPGRSIVAGASSDGTMRVWSAESGLELARSVHVLYNHSANVTSAIFHPNGRSVLFCENGLNSSLLLWDLATGSILRRMQGELQNVESTSFNSDGKLLAVVTREKLPGQTSIFQKGRGIVVLFDVETGQLVERVPTDKVNVLRARCSPTGPQVAFVGENQPIHIWDTKQRKIVHRLTGHTANIECFAFSPDGRQLAGAGNVEGDIFVWTLGKDDQPVRLKTEAPVTHAVKDVAFSPDGRVVAGIGAGTVAFWHLAQQRAIRYLLTTHDRLAFSSDGRFLVTTGLDQDSTRWERDANNKPIQAIANEDTHALVWDTSDLDSLLKQPQQMPPQTTSGTSSATPPAAAHDAVRQLRYLLVTDQKESREWRTFLKTATPGFPKINVDVGDSSARWQEVKLNTTKTGFDGIRFTSPLDSPADLHWSFHSQQGLASWMIDSPEGPIENFKNYWSDRNLRIPEVSVVEHNTFVFQRYEGGRILPGKEYVICFEFQSQAPMPLQFAVHLRKSPGGTINPAPAAPFIGRPPPETSGDEIKQAMGWHSPFESSQFPALDVERILIKSKDPFDFRPRLPLSHEVHPNVMVRPYQIFEE